jgi:hypothetical protein
MNREWYGDGTGIRSEQGKLFLDSVPDVASRRIVGFGLGEHHDAELAYNAVVMAVAVRGGKDAVAGVIMHTDRATSTPPAFSPGRLHPARHHTIHGPARLGARQRGDRVLALHRGVRTAQARALHHRSPARLRTSSPANSATQANRTTILRSPRFQGLPEVRALWWAGRSCRAGGRA